ncbi:ABC transporter ATP-binding protein [Nocardioides limicola]|uniref:ABC transporter ATP-binding protein n=1 Tax=Nocardioides limicola TaxID=2803368 RepID=UPI00193B77CC|nr:ABC transporter ATP-binding protein [Nocardioides sp. DJM-14]
MSKYYAKSCVVDDVNLASQPGEFLTLLGPSGSGKTTTLRMIAGFLNCDRGSISIQGRDVTGVPAHKRGTGMVFQHYALFPHLTAEQNVAFPLRMRGMGRREARATARSMLERMHLDGRGQHLPAQLSGGQQQRVALARALVFEPTLLLMDEPLGALDKKLRDALQIEIVNICREIGVTVVYVTHDQEEALAMSDRIAIYKDGRIAQIGTGEELYERPASVFVSQFIGSSNVIEGDYDAQLGVLRSRAGSVRVEESAAVGTSCAKGGPASLVIRPERIEVCSEGTPLASGRSHLTGLLEESTYLGSVHRYQVQLADGTTVQARMPALARADVWVGDRVQVVWNDRDAVLLEQEQSTVQPSSDSAGEVTYVSTP